MVQRPPERVVIRGVTPEIECGRFPIKRVVGEDVVVEADIFADGHDSIAAVIRHRHEDDERWSEVPLQFLWNDRWRGSFTVWKLGQHVYTITAWIDLFQTWYNDFRKRVAADQDVTVDLQIGAALLKNAAERANGADARKLQHLAKELNIADVD